MSMSENFLHGHECFARASSARQGVGIREAGGLPRDRVRPITMRPTSLDIGMMYSYFCGL